MQQFYSATLFDKALTSIFTQYKVYIVSSSCLEKQFGSLLSEQLLVPVLVTHKVKKDDLDLWPALNVKYYL